MQPTSDSTPNIIVNHLGFYVDDLKQAVFPDIGCAEFEVQDMAQNATESVSQYEDWKPVFRGELRPEPCALGPCMIGDFSALRHPGTYRLTLPGGLGRSFVFAIHDGILSSLPRLWLNYFHDARCGDHENEWRGPCHMDDGILSITGEQIDATGGWHDAGDTRKWMGHCISPALGMAEIKSRLGLTWNHWQEAPWNDDLLAEIAWGIRFILKVRDPKTGMIYEDVGGGGNARVREGMKWWHENHAGCYADNSENRFTDNIPGSGDERPIRQNYNPIVQYLNIVILLRAARLLGPLDPSLAQASRAAAFAAWQFMEPRLDDDYHGWTAIRSWRLQAAIEMNLESRAGHDVVERAVQAVLDLHDPKTGFWFQDATRHDYYRAILHSAQPLIALANYAEVYPQGALVPKCAETVRACFRDYIAPMRETNAFGVIPFGMFPRPPSKEDHYRPWRDGIYYRFFMPVHTPEKVNHGLGGHWTSWCDALAYCGKIFGEETGREAALSQLHWLLGNNPLNASSMNGVGYNQPMPHSRFFGQMQGGFMIGPRGNAADEFYMDLAGRADWSTCEYWTINQANSLMALTHLLPQNIPASRKLGIIQKA